MEQLSGMDAAFLALETPSTPMHVLGTVVLDPGDAAEYSFERLREVLLERLHLMPPFRRRLVEVPFGLDRPYWVNDGDFDIDEHLHRATAPDPGDETALAEVVSASASEMLPRDRPLWEIRVVEGLEGGRVAMVAKLHHATIYGVAGAAMIAHLFDLEPDGREVDPPEEPFEPEEPPGTAGLVARALAHQATIPARAVGNIASTLGRGARAAPQLVRRAASGPGALPFSAPRTPFNGALTPARAIAFAHTPLDVVKGIKERLGGTVNDVILAVSAVSIRRYLDTLDQVPSRDIVASVPVNLGSGGSETTNTIGVLLVPLPMSLTDPVEVLHAISARTEEDKRLSSSVGASFFADWAELTTPMLIEGGARLYDELRLGDRHRPLNNVVVSNIPGPPIRVYVAGAAVEAVIPFGPLLPGQGLNITAMSTMGNLDIGVMLCPDLSPGVWEVADGFGDAIEELAGA